MDGLKYEIDKKYESLNGQFYDFKKKITEELDKSSENLLRNFEGNLMRVENNEKNTQNCLNEFTLFKIENANKFIELENSISSELKEMRKDISNHSLVLENLENKINDNLLNMNRDITEMIKDVNNIKIEIELVKNFKENSLLNFKEIGDEFLKNEETYKKMTYKINSQLRDFETKINLFEQTFTMNNENFLNTRKDIYSQIYDSNLNINNKLQIFNETINLQSENLERQLNEFQSNLMVNSFIKRYFNFLN